MIVSLLQRLGGLVGVSVHRRSSIDKLLNELEGHRRAHEQPVFSGSGVSSLREGLPDDPSLEEKCAWLSNELRKHEDRQIIYCVKEDDDWLDKTRRIIDGIDRFGEADFADLAEWLFASSLTNHRVVHQRIDEGALLWRAVKMSRGPILEVGRAAGGSTLILLGASGDRPVVSIDRAPFHANVADQAFARPDVARRLTLYRQTSREPIAEKEFGLIFIDADHSYEGVCQDIATFWNQLKPFDGEPPLAAFHDAAANPITFVEPVKRACEELLAEPGVARVVESWGSMLVLEKTGNINQDRWFAKEHREFWERYAGDEEEVLRPVTIRDSLHPDRTADEAGKTNLLGDENVDDESWIKHGLRIDRAELNADNPLRLLRETPEYGQHGFEKAVPLNLSRFRFSAFLRPHRLQAVRFSILSDDRSVYAQVDFELGEHSRVGWPLAGDGVEILDAGLIYRNGYFGCSLSVVLPTAAKAATFAVNALESAGSHVIYQGDGKRGFFVNLSSVRELL